MWRFSRCAKELREPTHHASALQESSIGFVAEVRDSAPSAAPVTCDFQTQTTTFWTERRLTSILSRKGWLRVVLYMEDGTTVEVGVIGKDGVVGLPILLGGVQMPGETFIQIEGSGFRIEAQFMKEQFERPGQLRNHLQKYLLANLLQSAQNAACNRLHTIGERLARWLLTCHDRVESDQMPLTHEFLAQMLGAPRTTVTLAAGMLHQAGFIDYSRGHVTIKNRAELENAACECYGVVRKEFDRLGLF
jgi:CRP-like cAMP-binding protein